MSRKVLMSVFDDLFRPRPLAVSHKKQKWEIDPGAPWMGEQRAEQQIEGSPYWGQWLFGVEQEDTAVSEVGFDWGEPSGTTVGGEGGTWLVDLVGFELSTESGSDGESSIGSSCQSAGALGYCGLYGVVYGEQPGDAANAIGGVGQIGAVAPGSLGEMGNFGGDTGPGSETSGGGFDAGASAQAE